MNSYEFHIGDYYRRAKNLSQTEHYIYRSLLDECYLSETPLSTDLRVIMREIGLTTDQKHDLEYILDRFFYLEDDGWHHEHVEQVLARVYAKSDQAREAANRRWEKHKRKAGASKKDADAMRAHSDCNADGMLPSNPLTLLPPKERKRKRFVPPSTEEVDRLIKAESLTNITAPTFINFYQSKNWMVGKTKMKDWQAAARGWSTRGAQNEANKRTDRPEPNHARVMRKIQADLSD